MCYVLGMPNANVLACLAGHLTQAQLAERIGSSAAYVSQISTGHRRASPRMAVKIEAASGGLVSRRDLRPDDWREIWPDMGG